MTSTGEIRLLQRGAAGFEGCVAMYAGTMRVRFNGWIGSPIEEVPVYESEFGGLLAQRVPEFRDIRVARVDRRIQVENGLKFHEGWLELGTYQMDPRLGLCALEGDFEQGGTVSRLRLLGPFPSDRKSLEMMDPMVAFLKLKDVKMVRFNATWLDPERDESWVPGCLNDYFPDAKLALRPSVAATVKKAEAQDEPPPEPLPDPLIPPEKTPVPKMRG